MASINLLALGCLVLVLALSIAPIDAKKTNKSPTQVITIVEDDEGGLIGGSVDKVNEKVIPNGQLHHTLKGQHKNKGYGYGHGLGYGHGKGKGSGNGYGFGNGYCNGNENLLNLAGLVDYLEADIKNILNKNLSNILDLISKLGGNVNNITGKATGGTNVDQITKPMVTKVLELSLLSELLGVDVKELLYNYENK